MRPSRSLTPLICLSIFFCLNILLISSLAPSLLGKQILAWIIGIFLFFVGQKINPKQSNQNKWLIFILACFLLLLPLINNTFTRGSRRWLDIGLLSIQPSEIVKPLLMVFLSNSQFPILFPIPLFLVAIEPDLGSTISILFLLIPIILFNRRLQKLTLIIGLLLLLASPIIWTNVLQEYQRHRIVNFINPNLDPLGQGYNVIQSKIAIGSGGIIGRGYKKGTQGQLLFLPEKHTDFIFAAAAEELGFIGIAVILITYFLLIKSLIAKAFSTNNHTLTLFILGITFQIWFQLFINIGMNVGILPVTGIPLPFLSVGGSSLMALLFSLGIVYSS